MLYVNFCLACEMVTTRSQVKRVCVAKGTKNRGNSCGVRAYKKSGQIKQTDSKGRMNGTGHIRRIKKKKS